jgi:glycosyltransferase involved in cell wall biosynthesis
MATYNSEPYVREQIDSILPELGAEDEVVIVDDRSTDGTLGVLRSLGDERIRIFVNDRNIGHVRSFETAMSHAVNEVIMLADHDDIWKRGRVRLLTDRLESTGDLLVASNFSLMDASGNSIGEPDGPIRADESEKHLANIARIFLGIRPYFGCTMAFRRELLPIVLPIPSFVEAHDLWIAMAANVIRSTAHVEERSLVRRLHKRNITPIRRRGPTLILKSRLILASSLAVLIARAARLRVTRASDKTTRIRARCADGEKVT